MPSLRTAVIQLAYDRPDLRSALLPLLRDKEADEMRVSNPVAKFYNQVLPRISNGVAELPRLSKEVRQWAGAISTLSKIPRDLVEAQLLQDTAYLDNMVKQFYRELLQAEEILVKNSYAYFREQTTGRARTQMTPVPPAPKPAPQGPRAPRAPLNPRGRLPPTRDSYDSV